jgi:hypothetical protein
MNEHRNYLLAVDGTETILIPLSHEADVDTIPCTYHNPTNRIVYLWHWRGSGVTWGNPWLVQSVDVGETMVIHYPDTFIMQATFEPTPRSSIIEESTVGDISRHFVLAGRCFARARARACDFSLT